MDIETLLYGFRSVTAADVIRKEAMIRYAHSLEANVVSQEEYASKIRQEIRNNVFGGDADDAYFTSLLSTFTFRDKNIDPFIGAILNKSVIQLNFQTRYLSTNHGPEVYIQDGGTHLFPVAMANANVAAGILVGDSQLPPLDWTKDFPNIDLNRAHLLPSLPEELAIHVARMGRKIGCIAVIREIGEIDFRKRYSGLEDKVDIYTSYVIVDLVSIIVSVAKNLKENYPGINIELTEHNGERGILIVHGIDGIPNIRVGEDIKCRFVYVKGQNFTDFRSYKFKEDEFIRGKLPSLIRTSAPLTEENVKKMKSENHIWYEAVIIKNGLLYSALEPHNETFLHLSMDGDIVMDYGNDIFATEQTSIYKNGKCIDDVVHSSMKLGPVLKVSGAAMPIAFTPTVHHWFSHFIIQCLPRIFILRDLGLSAKILVPHDLRRKQREMLHLLGHDESQLITIPEGVTVQADELIVPRAWPLMFSPYTARIFPEMLERMNIQLKTPSRRVLISRDARKSWRNMLNYDAVRFHLTKNFGFEEIRPESLSLKEEMELMANTRIMVGAEGAGLYGAGFSQRDCTVVSICDEDYMMPILATLSESKKCFGSDFQLCHVFGESFRSSWDMKRRLGRGHADWVVNPLAVGEMINDIFAGRVVGDAIAHPD